MFYKYTVSYASGTKLSGYAESDLPKSKVRSEIERRLFGSYRLRVTEFGEDFPPINSDYILSIR